MKNAIIPMAAMFFAALAIVLASLVQAYPSSIDLIYEMNKYERDNDVEYLDEKPDIFAQSAPVLFDHPSSHEIKVADHSKRWLNGIVPYVVDEAFDRITNRYLKYARVFIKIAMRKIEEKTCIRFVEFQAHNAPQQHIRFVNGKGCSSAIGRQPVAQELSLQIGTSRRTCLRESIIIHELLHALGFIHEQCRDDRNNFLKINMKNVSKGKKKNFVKKKPSINTWHKFDPDSILHYSRFTFSKNGKPTIEWKKNPKRRLGGNKLSRIDIEKINAVYCSKSTGTAETTPTTSTSKAERTTSTTTIPTTTQTTTTTTASTTTLTTPTIKTTTTSSTQRPITTRSDTTTTKSTTSKRDIVKQIFSFMVKRVKNQSGKISWIFKHVFWVFKGSR